MNALQVECQKRHGAELMASPTNNSFTGRGFSGRKLTNRWNLKVLLLLLLHLFSMIKKNKLLMGEIFSRDELKQCNKEVLITLFLKLQEQMIEMNGKLDRMAEQLAVAQNHRYGRKSEKLDVIDGQLCFNFNEVEALLENIYVVEPVEEDVIPTVVKRKKTRGKRKEDLSRLPVETISHTLSEEELTDIFGPDGWKQLPGETYMRVKVEPARYTVEEHHVCVYAGKTTDKIVKAFRPKSLLRNSIATPSLVASIMNAKYVNGMPLDRIATDFRRNEVNISKQVMANWVIRCSERYLSPVYFRLHELLLKYNVIQQDETPVEVSKDGRPANSKSYMWVYRSGKYYTDRVIILYEYQKTRKAEHPQRFLEGFHGVCECDAYAVYEKMDRENPDIAFAFCHAHARRYFAEALKALPKDQRDKAKGTIAHEALERIAGIYHMDNQLSELSEEERYRKRQLLVRPLVEALFAWLKKVRDEKMVPEGGKTMKGVNYYLNHEKQFLEFLNHGNVPLDNNATESALRNFCMHKHTWRLIDTINGAKASALVYSIVETAKANGLNPFRYLEFLLTEMMEHEEDTDYGFLDDLLPWSESIPDICKIQSKK